VSNNRYNTFEWRLKENKQAPEPQEEPLRIAVLLSGSGSNLQAIIDAIEDGSLPGVQIVLVVSNKANAYGLQRALKHKLPAIYLSWTPPPSTLPRDAMSECEEQLTTLLTLFHADLLIMAGWMRILSASFLAQFPQHAINIHPALLPADGMGKTYTTSDGASIPVFRGMHAVRQALDAGVKLTGSCVHYVTPEIDAGPVICREEVAIAPGDTEETLHERLKVVEHKLIVEAIRLLTH
jgi:phosphoribosylglycinamide formyltransferase-1